MEMTKNTILITGGGTGIGRALAEQFHARGNQVILAGRRVEPLQETAAANPGMKYYQLDTADKLAIEAFAATLKQDFPTLNAIINNAGIMQAEDLKSQTDTTIAERTITTNLLGVIWMTTAFLPQLLAQPRSYLMTVSSGLASIPLAATPTYNATKAAIHSYSQSLRSQLAGTSVEVIEIVPPAVATDLMPGHAQNPNSMPLDEYTQETIALLSQQPTPAEILVERVKFLRFAEARGEYDKVFQILNSAH